MLPASKLKKIITLLFLTALSVLLIVAGFQFLTASSEIQPPCELDQAVQMVMKEGKKCHNLGELAVRENTSGKFTLICDN